MASYNSILRHVSMKDVKRNTLKLQEQKFAKERHIQEAKCELRHKNSLEFCNWREETNLKESDWSSSSGSSPTNSSSQQFTYFTPNYQTGQPNTVTISGLGGAESIPSTVTVDYGFGETEVVPAPTFSQFGLQGYAKPLGMDVRRRTDLKDVNPQLDASQDFTQKVGADYMMNSRVQNAPPTPAYYPTDQSTVPGMVWIDNPMSASGGYWDYDSSKMGKEIAQVASSEDPSNRLSPVASSEDPSNRLSPRILPKQDAVLATLQYAFGLYDPKKTRKGGQTKELENAMLNTIGNSLRRGDTTGRVDATQDYSAQSAQNIPAQALLNNYGYSVTDKGIVVDDRFNFDGVYQGIGGAFGPLKPIAQFAADRLVDVGDAVSRSRGVDPRDDARAGFAVQYTIPWSRVPANHPSQKLKRKKKNVSESTWDKLKKHRVIN